MIKLVGWDRSPLTRMAVRPVTVRVLKTVTAPWSASEFLFGRKTVLPAPFTSFMLGGRLVQLEASV